MNVYTIYADLKEGTDPQLFLDSINAFFSTLDTLQAHRITRMKLGFRSKNIGEWRVDMEFKTMQDLDDAMELVLYNRNTTDTHINFTQYVDASSLDHFLYRDFPDEV
jgi:hypothetical protein